MTEILIVGRGLAATCLMHAFHQRGISFQVVGDPSLTNSSRVAAGIWNPVVFKRLTKSWKAEVFVPGLLRFYKNCEQTLGRKLFTERAILKPFTEDQEKKLWLKKSQLELEGFIDPTIHAPTENLAAYHIPNGYGRVLQAGNLHLDVFLEASAEFFKDSLLQERFEHKHLKIQEDNIDYKNIRARRLVFCEGRFMTENPYFNWLPLKPAKGEVLTLEGDFPGLENNILNKNGFLMQCGPNRYRLGATYEWTDLTEQPTAQGLAELESKIKAMTNKPYTILKHEAGVRPSSLDRRPLIGEHPQHKNLLVFNGLGTKGVMLAPVLAENFVNFCLKQEPLWPEVHIERFYHLYEQKS